LEDQNDGYPVREQKEYQRMNQPGITILGLGPGDPLLLTRQAWEILESVPEIFLRTRLHPTVVGFPAGLRVHSFDQYYEEGISFEEVYEKIVKKVISLGKRDTGVIYGVPGHPFIAEATAPEIARRANDEGIPITVVEGMSFVESIFGLLELDPFPHTVLVDGLELAIAHHPPFPPSVPAVIAQIHSPGVASDVKLTLLAVYPDNHQVQLVHGAGTKYAKIETLDLYQIDRSPDIGLLTALYIPPLGNGSSFEGFQEVIARLRGPDGCPWDRQQTHLSLRPFLLEETYEVLSALDDEDQEALQEELGDLLLQIVLHSQIASEYGDFSMVNVIQEIQDKLIRRHPHVFGDLDIEDQQMVLENWEKLKSIERNDDESEKNGILTGVSPALPALVQAETYQERVNRVGFDWSNIQGVFEKISEEIIEVQEAQSSEEYETEIGDLLFAVVNLARWFEIDAESALRRANTRFRNRFEAIESEVKSRGKDLTDLSLDELDELWNTVKRKGLEK
jgi:tetrapyrrole methylase family protein/MazG family protein